MKSGAAIMFALFAGLACLPPVGGDGGIAGDSGVNDGGNQITAICSEPSTLFCEDEHILRLLSGDDDVSPGAVTTTEADGVFTTAIDATAGGMSAAPDNPFVYVRFGDAGMDKVAIGDESALASMDWDLSARRFVVLLNSGDVGPSCVGAQKVAGDFDEVTAASASGGYSVEDVYDQACAYQPDLRFGGSFDSPESVLKEWWLYESCVATSGQVFVIRRADGRLVKMVVDAFYATGQADCNTMGIGGGGSANLKIRWAWL